MILETSSTKHDLQTLWMGEPDRHHFSLQLMSCACTIYWNPFLRALLKLLWPLLAHANCDDKMEPSPGSFPPKQNYCITAVLNHGILSLSLGNATKIWPCLFLLLINWCAPFSFLPSKSTESLKREGRKKERNNKKRKTTAFNYRFRITTTLTGLKA